MDEKTHTRKWMDGSWENLTNMPPAPGENHAQNQWGLCSTVKGFGGTPAHCTAIPPPSPRKQNEM